MTHSRWLIAVTGLIAGLGSSGCAVRASGGVHAVAHTPDVRLRTQVEVQAPQIVVFQEPPPLVMVEPDIYVVEDHDHAVYYTGGFYWEYRGDSWYHTSRWDQPWARVTVNVVPPTIAHRNHNSYVRFRATGQTEVWREPRVHVGGHVGLERHARVERPDGHHPTPAAAPAPDRADQERAERAREQDALRIKQEREQAELTAARQHQADNKADVKADRKADQKADKADDKADRKAGQKVDQKVDQKAAAQKDAEDKAEERRKADKKKKVEKKKPVKDPKGH